VERGRERGMVVQGGLSGSSAIAARKERRPCRANEHYGLGDFLQAPRVAERRFESLKRSLMGQTRLVPVPFPKTPLEYPETQSLLPSPNTYSHEGFGTKPGQDLVHPFVWPHRSFTARTSYLKRRRLARRARSSRGREATPRPDVGGVGDEETQPN
jgi:hypothetical protein